MYFTQSQQDIHIEEHKSLYRTNLKVTHHNAAYFRHTIRDVSFKESKNLLTAWMLQYTNTSSLFYT